MTAFTTTADGIPSVIAETVITLPYNDPQGVERIIDRHHYEVAALIVEPVIGAGGILLPPASPITVRTAISASCRT